MATLDGKSRHAIHSRWIPGSSHDLGRRRPPLLRSCATAPSITTSNACRDVPTEAVSTRKASELLSKVAIISTSVGQFAGAPPPMTGVHQHSIAGNISIRQAEASLDQAVTPGIKVEGKWPSTPAYCTSPTAKLMPVVAECYFSFPSFDEWGGNDLEPDTSFGSR